MVFGRRDGKIKGRFFFPCRGLGAWEYEKRKRKRKEQMKYVTHSKLHWRYFSIRFIIRDSFFIFLAKFLIRDLVVSLSLFIFIYLVHFSFKFHSHTRKLKLKPSLIGWKIRMTRGKDENNLIMKLISLCTQPFLYIYIFYKYCNASCECKQ